MTQNTVRGKCVCFALIGILGLGVMSTSTKAADPVHGVPALQDQLAAISAKLDSLSTGKVVRVAAHLDDGADNRYDGTVTFHRSTGTGAYQLEQLYLCGFHIGDDLPGGAVTPDSSFVQFVLDGKRNVTGNADPYVLEINAFVSNVECIDVLRTNYSVTPDLRTKFLLGGDESHDVKLSFIENDSDADDDSDGAELIAYVSGLDSASDLTVTSTLGDE